MAYLVIGTIIVLAAVGLLMVGHKLIGIILVLIGVFIGLKGRRELDKFK